jgi:RHS repeat-associated protein
MKSADPLVQPDDRFTYDTLGNLSSSTRRGAYTFDPAKPTQVIAVTGGVPDMGKRTYGYDFLGNQVSRPEGKVVYNDFNLPARYTTHANETTASFLYDAAGQRTRKISSAGTVTYVAGLYERHSKSDGTIEHQLLVPEAGATLRYLEQNGSLGSLPIIYTYGDHLGSTSLLTQQDPGVTGYKTMVVEKRSDESFGRPRNPDWKSPDIFGGIQPTLLDQGYTGHTEDREHGLINMKGRIYHPMLGRFLTPDPYVDGTNVTQRWNRYAYVSNNPLSFTDPSGFRMNLEAIKERVEANATMFSWAVGTLEGQFSTDFEKFMSGHVGAGEFEPVNPGSPLAATQLWKSAMVADWAARRADACSLGCSAKQLDKLMQEFAEDWNLPIKVKHQDVNTKNPLKEAAPSTNGSVSGNDVSGYADEALDPTASAAAPDTSPAPMSTIIFELPGAGRDVFHIYDGSVDFHPITETTGGLIRASTLRVLAHELGHKIMGDLDDGLKHLK